MSPQDAVDHVNGLQEKLSDGRWRWKDRLHVATHCFRTSLHLSRDHNACLVYAELYLNRVLPSIDWFAGIFAVDYAGVWFYDGDGNIDESIWRQYLIPWHAIDSFILHHVS